MAAGRRPPPAGVLHARGAAAEVLPRRAPRRSAHARRRGRGTGAGPLVASARARRGLATDGPG